MSVATETHSEEVAAELLWRRYPHTFAQQISANRWRPFAFQRYIGRVVGQAIATGNGRVLVHLPPRHGKTDICAFWTAVWFLEHLPDERIILAC